MTGGGDAALDAVTQAVVDELVAKHRCHTIILHGSRAVGEHSDSSDFDVLGVREHGAKTRDARRFGDEYLDAAIHPEADLGEPLAEEFVRLRRGKVLRQKGAFGDELVARAASLFKAGPKPLAAHESELIRSWVTKTIARVARGGSGEPGDVVAVEASYRRVWLLTQMLEDYFKLRGRWYLGPKESFAWLRGEDPQTFALFESALRPDASRGELRRLADRVLTGS